MTSSGWSVNWLLPLCYKTVSHVGMSYGVDSVQGDGTQTEHGTKSGKANHTCNSSSKQLGSKAKTLLSRTLCLIPWLMLRAESMCPCLLVLQNTANSRAESVVSFLLSEDTAPQSHSTVRKHGDLNRIW
jgi:hypothetical protein